MKKKIPILPVAIFSYTFDCNLYQDLTSRPSPIQATVTVKFTELTKKYKEIEIYDVFDRDQLNSIEPNEDERRQILNSFKRKFIPLRDLKKVLK